MTLSHHRQKSIIDKPISTQNLFGGGGGGGVTVELQNFTVSRHILLKKL